MTQPHNLSKGLIVWAAMLAALPIALADAPVSRIGGVATTANGLKVARPQPVPVEELPNPATGGTVDLHKTAAPSAGRARTDDELRRRIQQELNSSPFVPPGKVRVEVEHGVATLTGIVSSEHAVRAAVANARAAGAVQVRNNLHTE